MRGDTDVVLFERARVSLLGADQTQEELPVVRPHVAASGTQQLQQTPEEIQVQSIGFTALPCAREAQYPLTSYRESSWPPRVVH